MNEESLAHWYGTDAEDEFDAYAYSYYETEDCDIGGEGGGA